MWSHLRYSSSVSNPSFPEVGLYPHKHKKKKSVHRHSRGEVLQESEEQNAALQSPLPLTTKASLHAMPVSTETKNALNTQALNGKVILFPNAVNRFQVSKTLQQQLPQGLTHRDLVWFPLIQICRWKPSSCLTAGRRTYKVSVAKADENKRASTLLDALDVDK